MSQFLTQTNTALLTVGGDTFGDNKNNISNNFLHFFEQKEGDFLTQFLFRSNSSVSEIMREMVDRCWGRKSEHGTHRLQQWSAIVYPFDSDYTTKIFVHDFRLGRKSRMRIPRFSSHS